MLAKQVVRTTVFLGWVGLPVSNKNLPGQLGSVRPASRSIIPAYHRALVPPVNHLPPVIPGTAFLVSSLVFGCSGAAAGAAVDVEDVVGPVAVVPGEVVDDSRPHPISLGRC